jgi:predicted nucleic acid-binding protein
MNNAVLTDTGPLYALADADDQYHVRAETQLDRMSSTGQFVAITYFTLAEAYTLVLRRLGTAYAHRWLKQVVEGSMLINPEPVDYVRALDFILSFKDQSITIFDAVTSAVSERLKMPLWTYDRHFDMMRANRWT